MTASPGAQAGTNKSTAGAIERLKSAIRAIPDFPKEGILFRDITPVLADGELLRLSIQVFVDRYRNQGLTKVVGIDARGFIFGAALAYELGIGFIPVRKKGKLPFDTYGVEYDLEYGSNSVEIHTDALSADDKIIIIDDLLATGGTMAAAIELAGKSDCTLVEVAFLIELSFLHGREKLTRTPVYTAISY